MKKNNSPNQKTNHHIYPTSRSKGKGIEGIAKVERYLHENYHHLFGNQTPEEILEFLNKTFWNEMFVLTIKRKEEL